MLSLVRRYSESIASLQTAEFLILFGLMLAPTLFLGMTGHSHDRLDELDRIGEEIVCPQPKGIAIEVIVG